MRTEHQSTHTCTLSRGAIAISLLAIALGGAACPRRPAPPPEAGPADAAPPPAAGAAAPRPATWLRVTTDLLPFFRAAEAEADELSGFLPAGALLERRDDLSVSTEAAHEEHPLAPGLKRPPGSPIPGKGPLVHVFRSDDVQGFTFLGGLAAPAVALPPRAALCDGVAAGAPPPSLGLVRAACVGSGQFFAIEGAAPRVAVVINTGAEAARLSVLEIGSAVPVLRGGVELGTLRNLRQFALTDGAVLFLVEEFVRAGNLTGTRHAVVVVDAAGQVTRQAELPAESSEPSGDAVTQRRFHVEVTRSGDDCAITAQGTETIQVISTGATRSEKKLARKLRWDRAQRRFSFENTDMERSRK